jgi:hypothetical protein
VAAGQDLLEGSRQRVKARPGAGQLRDVDQVRHGVVGSVCADADHDALALAQRGGRASTDGGDQGFDAGICLAGHVIP